MQRQMQSQMQSLDIKRTAERSNQAKASAILTDCHRPTAATEGSTIKRSTARCPATYYTDQVLPTVPLLTVLPLTVLFYLQR